MRETSLRSGIKSWLPAWAVAGIRRLRRPSRRSYWNSRAVDLEETYGAETHDFATISRCIQRVGAKSVIEIGCGYGRLFPVYYEQRVDFLGSDLSEVALASARSKFPAARLLNLGAERLTRQAVGQDFDLAIFVRALMGLSPSAAARALDNAAAIAGAIYLDEPLFGELGPLPDYLFEHDYDAEMKRRSFALVDRGRHMLRNGTTQAWSLWRRT